MTKTAYVKHPITADQKAHLKRLGMQIIDVNFMPEGAQEFKFAPKYEVLSGAGKIGVQVATSDGKEAGFTIDATAAGPSHVQAQIMADGTSRLVADNDGNVTQEAHTIEGAPQPVFDQLMSAVDDTINSLGTDAGDQFSDKELRAIIHEVTGIMPGNAAKRETLVARFNELNAAEAAKVDAAIQAATSNEE